MGVQFSTWISKSTGVPVLVAAAAAAAAAAEFTISSFDVAEEQPTDLRDAQKTLVGHRIDRRLVDVRGIDRRAVPSQRVGEGRREPGGVKLIFCRTLLLLLLGCCMP